MMRFGAHARDELGISDALKARPIQAALASAGRFAVGARHASPCHSRGTGHVVDHLGVSEFTAVTRGSRSLGGPRRWRSLIPGAIRVTFSGALAMGVTTGVGTLWHDRLSRP